MSLATRIGALLLATLMWSAPACAADPDWPEAITVATGSPGGTYYVYGEGLVNILSRALGIRVSTLATDGPSENIELIESGEAQIGFVTMGVAQQAWNGTGAWTGGVQQRSVRAMFPMYDTPFHFIVLQELRGSRDPRSGRQAARGGTGGRDKRHLHAAAA